MAYLTPRYIYRRQRTSDLPRLHALGLPASADPHCCMSVLDRKTLTVIGSVCREVLADENHRAYGQRLSAVAETQEEHNVFLRDVMRGLSHVSSSQTWFLSDACLRLQTVQSGISSLANTAIAKFRSIFPGASVTPDGKSCTLSNGNDCTFLLRADALPCGLLLTAGFTPYAVLAGPAVISLLTLRMSRFADTEADVIAFADEALAMYRPLCDADKVTLKAYHEAKQKAFLKRIDAHLKPLGFRKRGTRWECLTSGATLVFEAQKARFSDQIFLNLWHPSAASNIRLEQDIDWQLLSAQDIDDLMHLFLAEDILPLIPSVQNGTSC